MKTLNKILLSAGLITALAFPVQALADNQKIGVVDMRKVVTSSKQAKDMMDKLKAEFKSREDKIVATDKSLKEKSEKLQRNGAVMGQAEKDKLEKEVITAQRELQRLQGEFREDAAIRQQEETKKLVDRINVVIQDIAKKEKYDLIIHSEAAPFAANQLDITDKVIKAISNA